MDLAPGTPESVVLLNAVEGAAFFYELPFEVSDREPPLNGAEEVATAQRALSALLLAGLVEVVEESPLGQSTVLGPNESERAMANSSSWQPPHDREDVPIYLIKATAAGRRALLGGQS